MSPPGEITVELMQQMLREVEKDSSIVVLPSLVVKELDEDFHGGSCLSRVTVEYTRHGDTSQHSLSLIVKTLPNNTLVEVIKESSVFVREIQMFDEILPRMSALLAQAIPDRYKDFCAQVYYTRESPSFLIAVEDLAPKGFKSPKRKHGLDLKHSMLAIKTLARFHAASVKIQREDESLLTVFDKYSFQELDSNETMRTLKDNLISIITEKMESWPGLGSVWADRVRHRSQALSEDLRRIWKRDDSVFNVLNHGDFGVHNVMYRHSESSGELEDIMLVDFQCCSYNSPALDLHQFIFGSASDQVREDNIDTLLEEYHTELLATLEALGAPPENTITKSQLYDEFNRTIAQGFYYLTFFLPLLGIDASSYPDLTINDFFENSSDSRALLEKFVTDSYLTHLSKVLPRFSQHMFA